MPLYPAASYRNAASAAPEDTGLIAWNCDPSGFGTAAVLSGAAGQLTGMRLYVPKVCTITNLVAWCQTVGVTLTAAQCKGALYDASGALLGTTVDQAAAWVATGLKTMALATPVQVVPGLYDLCFWFNGTTGPAFTRASGIGLVQAGGTGTGLRFFTTSDTGRTTTAPGTLGTKTAANLAWWVAVS